MPQQWWHRTPQNTCDPAKESEAVLDHIELHSSKVGMPPGTWMINRVVEYHDEDDTISADEWPPIIA